ncbi:MAG TPA: DUF2232 domain-containing protein [Candidatus Hydrogenedentes bacterium]|nr:DUF2232 domain-containing protein [Candidatus Hydrogenedentota bacterium]HOL77630.1 DUF2232 domain-containing protein [Candidatus Hydrogenedentota bacterium]HPO86755.1 DUF2232 domain-containing protein [Candidatus Hydrogenedentota bacterium]
MYILVWLVQANVGAVLGLFGASTLELAILPIAVGTAFGSGKTYKAVGLIVAAAAGAGLVRLSLVFAAYYAFVASLGFLIGLAARRGWTYGQTVSLCTAAAFSVTLVAALTTWENWVNEGTRIYEQWSAFLVNSHETASEELANEVTDQMGWLLREHWVDLGLGMMFSSTLLMICVGVSVASRRLRLRYGTAGPSGGFSEMRVPEWLVWTAIAAAGLWFLDNQRPDLGLRPFVWNIATGLTAIYWLNGVSVAFFAAALAGTPFAYMTAFVCIALCGAYIVFFVGLFDTWFDFRRRLDSWHKTLPRLQGPGS